MLGNGREPKDFEETDMKRIELESRNDLFRGCAAPGVRMNEALLELYGEPEKRLLRARCATGVRIAMFTDAVEVEFSFLFGRAARQVFTADLQVDGVLFATVTGEGPHRIPLPAGEKELVLHFPHLVEAEEFSFSVDDAASVRPAPGPERKLLICGDSIMQGMTCTTPLRAVGTILAARLGMEFHNTSVGGATMTAAAVRGTCAIGGDGIVVGFGINDVFLGTPVETFREECEGVCGALGEFPGKAFMVTPIPCLKKENEPVEELREIIRNSAGDFPRITLIEGPEIFPAEEEFYVDGTHPNDAGMAVYAARLAKIMAPLLKA